MPFRRPGAFTGWQDARRGQLPSRDQLVQRQSFQIHLWDVVTGHELRRFGSPKGGSYEVAFSADGRMLVSAGEDGRVRLWEVATGKERFALVGHQGPVTSLALSRDGWLILSGSYDTTALIWDILGLDAGGGPRIADKELLSLWTDLESDDAAKAFRAMSRLSRSPAQTLPFLKKRLKPIRAPEEKRLVRLLGDLESEQFALREKAARELENLCEAVEPALRKALADRPTAELRKRAELLLEKVDSSVGRLRQLRSLEMLERLATPEARELLSRLAFGMPKAWLTRQAKASLARHPRDSAPSAAARSAGGRLPPTVMPA